MDIRISIFSIFQNEGKKRVPPPPRPPLTTASTFIHFLAICCHPMFSGNMKKKSMRMHLNSFFMLFKVCLLMISTERQRAREPMWPLATPRGSNPLQGKQESRQSRPTSSSHTAFLRALVAFQAAQTPMAKQTSRQPFKRF